MSSPTPHLTQHEHPLAGAAFLLITLCLTGCPKPQPRFVAKVTQLPDDPKELVAIADAAAAKEVVVGKEPAALQDLARAKAALDKALASKTRNADINAFTLRWRLARNAFLMANLLRNKTQLVEICREGMKHGEAASKLQPKRVEGHYYFALTMARIAEAKWKLTYVKAIVAAGERARAIDETYDNAGPLAFLGKVYLTAPAWPVSVGNPEKAVELLERAVELAPKRPLHHLFLGQAYLAEEEPEKAIEQLKIALAAKLDPRWRREAQEALEKAKDEL